MPETPTDTGTQYAGLTVDEAVLAAADLHMSGCDAPTIAECADCGLRLHVIRRHLDALQSADRLLPEGGETREEWAATIGAPSGFFVQPQHVRRHRADAESEVETLAEDTADLPAVAVLVRREIRTFADKSMFVGPWVAVDQEKPDA